MVLQGKKNTDDNTYAVEFKQTIIDALNNSIDNDLQAIYRSILEEISDALEMGENNFKMLCKLLF